MDLPLTNPVSASERSSSSAITTARSFSLANLSIATRRMAG